GQMINILTEQNVQASLASLVPADILIEPTLGDFSATDFDHLLLTVPIGEEGARRVASRLEALGVTRDEYAALDRRRTAALAPDLRPVDEIRFSNLTRVNPSTEILQMETKPGEPLDPQALDRDLRRLFGTGDFEHVNYRLIEEAGRR